MTAFTGLGDYAAKASGVNVEHRFWCKTGRVAGAAGPSPTQGRWNSAWLYEGAPCHGAAPGAVAIPTRTTNGALGQTDPGGGRQKFITYVSASSTDSMTHLLYDRLLHISGFSGTVTTAQNVGGTLTRNTGGVGNRIFIEIYTQIGASVTTVTASYTNQAGASKTTPTWLIGGTGFREATRMWELPLANGDTGVQSVVSITLAGTTGTAGDFGVTVVKPYVMLHSPEIAGIGVSLLKKGRGPVPVTDGACLAWAWIPRGITPLEAHGSVVMVES